MDRVAELLDEWAESLDLADVERARWRAAGQLHDALRDEEPAALRGRVPPSLRGVPGAVLHGPAAAERLRIGGVDDGELLTAVGYHTLGDPRMKALGRAVYAADFLEPGRSFRTSWRAGLRERMPEDLDDVVTEVARARIGRLLERGAAVHPSTVDFWNALVEDVR